MTNDPAVQKALEHARIDLQAAKIMCEQTLREPHGINQTLAMIDAALAALTAPSPQVDSGREEIARDAARYRRLQVLGCAPGFSRQLEARTVLRFTGLDEFVDADIETVPSRGEALRSERSGGRG